MISPRRPPTEPELREAVRKQWRFIVTSGNLVAHGDYDEAVRVAVALRVLLHDTSRSHSVLGQLEWKTNLNYVDSLRELDTAPGVSVSFGTDADEDFDKSYGLVVLGVDPSDGSTRYVAPLGSEPVTTTLPFDSWWKKKVLYSQGVSMFSRWDLVDSMAHRDGGAHVDPRGLSKEYEEFKLRGDGGFSVPLAPGVTGPPQQIDFTQVVYHGDAASPSVLQIAWELIETLNRAGLPDGPAPSL